MQAHGLWDLKLGQVTGTNLGSDPVEDVPLQLALRILPGLDRTKIDRLKDLSRFKRWWGKIVVSWWSDLSG